MTEQQKKQMMRRLLSISSSNWTLICLSSLCFSIRANELDVSLELHVSSVKHTCSLIVQPFIQEPETGHPYYLWCIGPYYPSMNQIRL